MNLSAWKDSLHDVLLGNSLEAWCYAALVLVLTLGVLPLIKREVQRRLSRAATVRRALALALVKRTRFVLFLAIALYLSAQTLALPARAERILELIVIVFAWFQVGLWTSALVVHVLREQLIQRGAAHLAQEGGFIVVSVMAQAVVWVVALALALSNAGVNIIAMIAGLGMGGAAIALAARGMLSNLFANASISLDKLFFVGDTLVSGEFQGRVEQVGNRATQIRSVNGELILISNADLLKSRLRNMGRAEERREVLTVRLSRDTSAARVREAIGLIADIVKAQPAARLERCHFAQLNLDALRLEAVYHVRTDGPDLALVRDAIDVDIDAALFARGIRFEYPLQRLHLASA